MSTTLEKRSLAQAADDAGALRKLFAGTYAEWHVAGSVRRRVPHVGDVEHVVVPRVAMVPAAGDLFGREVAENLVLLRSDELVAAGAADRHVYPDGRTRWGNRYRGLSFRGFAHELFIADADRSNLGPTLAIRTGPAEFSRMLVTQLQWRGHVNMGGYVLDKSRHACGCGWAGHERECRWVAGHVGRALVKDPDGRDGGPFAAFCPACGRADRMSMPRVSVPTERAYLELCGVGWVEPEERR